MNILVVVAHPDDEVLGMGGTILKHAIHGDTVTVAYMTTGITSRRSSKYQNVSSYGINKKLELDMKKQIEELRKDAKKACNLLNVKKFFFFDFPDNEMDTVPLLKIVKTIEKLVKEIKPERIYTSHYGDLNIDHRVVFESSLVATRPVGIGKNIEMVAAYETISETHWNAPYIEPNFSPNLVIDVSNYLSKKIEALKCYESQISFDEGPRSIKAISALAQFRGSQSGFEFGEAFYVIRMTL